MFLAHFDQVLTLWRAFGLRVTVKRASVLDVWSDSRQVVNICQLVSAVVTSSKCRTVVRDFGRHYP